MSKTASTLALIMPTHQHIKLALIDVSPQIRTRNGFDDESIEQLAQSIKVLGLLQPLVVTTQPDGERYALIAGHRRLAALQKLKIADAPCSVHGIAKDEAAEIQIVENIQREDLTLADTADGVRLLLGKLKSTALVAGRLGKSASWVSKHASLTGPTFSAIARALLDAGHTDDLELLIAVNQIAKIKPYPESELADLIEKIKAGRAGRQHARDLLDQLKNPTPADEGEGEGDGEGEGEEAGEVLGKLELAEAPARALWRFVSGDKPATQKAKEEQEALLATIAAFINKTWPKA